MTLTFTWSFNKQFANEFKAFPKDQQDKILDFLDVYEEHGMSDFSCFPGKLCCSWRGLDDTDPNYHYSIANNLWHYHVGLPVYVSVHPGFMTSDWVLHLQWERGSTHIDIADMYTHHTADGQFYLPSPAYLRQAG